MIIEFLKNLRSAKLKAAKVDPKRLLSIARSASDTAFSMESGGLPICLFKTAEFSAETFDKRHLVFKNYEKGQLTEPLMAPSVSNEDEWFAETLKEHVAGFVMVGILNQAKSFAVDASTPEQYWAELKKAAQSIVAKSLHPVLLVERQTRPQWIWDWRLPPMEDHLKRPDDLQIWKEESEKAGEYFAHFNDVAVYTAPIAPGASLVVPRELFKRIVFTKFSTGYSVDVGYEPTERDEVVNLVLTWAYKIELDTHPVIRLEYYYGKEPQETNQ